jgi:Kef-type K+ transport system membrane component KefB
MDSYVFLLSIAIILLATKVSGDLTNKVHMPQVVGALLAGVILGPSCLGWIEETDFISKTAEIGVILLMFTAGFDTDINEMKKNSKACLIIALLGVFVPLIGGTACYYFFFEAGSVSYDVILKAVFVGVILTATSVSITVEALREMGKLDGKAVNFGFEAKSLYSLTFSTKGFLEFYYNNDYFMLVPNDKDQPLIKWTLASEEINNLHNEKWRQACASVYDYDKGESNE